MPGFIWTPDRTRAAELIALADMTRQEIADEVGVDRKSLYNWLSNPEFKARVDEAAAELKEEVRATGICDRTNRMAKLNAMMRAHEAIVTARASNPIMQNAPGGSTGFLTRDVKRVAVESDDAGAPKRVEVEVFRYDAALAREMRELMKQAAIEAGEWQEQGGEEKTKPWIDSEATRRALADPRMVELMLEREALMREYDNESRH